jgi:hypothetical protein
MRQYLETDKGEQEVKLLQEEMEKSNKKMSKLLQTSNETETTNHKTNLSSIEKEMYNKNNKLKLVKLKESVLEIYHKFSIPDPKKSQNNEKDESEESLNEFSSSISSLSVRNSDKITVKAFRQLISELDCEKIDEKFIFENFLDSKKKFDLFSTIDFDLTYSYILKELHITKQEREKRFKAHLKSLKKNNFPEISWKFPKNIFFLGSSSNEVVPLSIVDEDDVDFNKLIISEDLRQKLFFMESRLSLLRCTVKQFEREARAEYRISHPPRFLCEHCQECFIDSETLHSHVKVKKLK